MESNPKPCSGIILQGNDATMAFSRPGGEASKRVRSRPLDLEHLSRQTMGDRRQEEEIVAMFAHQIADIRKNMPAADGAKRLMLAHTLKGTARNVGAFALGDCAEQLEVDPGNKTLLSRLAKLIDETRDFIAAISR